MAALAASSGRRLTLGELATRFPNATLEGKGLPLSKLAETPINKKGPDGSSLTLAAGTIDKNGDVDVTRLFQNEVARFNQNLVVHRQDERPIPLEYGLRNGDFRVGEPSMQEAFKKAGFATTKDGVPTFDMRDTAQVEKALRTVGIDPADTVRLKSELMKLGVSVPLSREDQLRRVVCGALDSPLNYVDLDDALVNAPGAHNEQIAPTVYGSAKVSTEHPEDVILSYKRFNTSSYAAQGSRLAQVLGKDTKSQHEGDMEVTFVKIDSRTHELKTVLAARHSYGELYDRSQVERLQAETGLAAPTIGVSYKAHGGDLVGASTRHTFAGAGEDGVREGDWKDHVLTEDYAGTADTAPGGSSTLIKASELKLVLEADDQQTLNMKVRLGDQRKGLFGTKVLDQFNDGVRMDRFFGTRWYYRQEQLNLEKAGQK